MRYRDIVDMSEFNDSRPIVKARLPRPSHTPLHLLQSIRPFPLLSFHSLPLTRFSGQTAPFIVHVDISVSNDLDVIRFVVETDKLGRRVGETLDARYKAVEKVMIVFSRAMRKCACLA